jgi:phage-related protein
MNLLLVSKGFYTVYAVAKSREHCELLEFLEGLGQTLQKDSDRMLALLGRVAMEGPPRNTEISHQIKGKLFEFIQGRLRVLWFYDEGRLIICTSGFIKKGRKTPRNEMEHAIQIMNEYFKDKKRGEIKICEEEVIR